MSIAAACSKTFRVTLAMLGLLATAPAIELKPKTVEAFNRYVRLSETRIQQELSKQGTFLWMDSVPQPQRDQVQARLRAGEIVIERLETFDGGQEIEVPDGLIHHWLGVVFIPGTTLKSTLALVQDYDTHAKVYKPDVLAAKLVSRNGNDFKIFLRLFKKKVITVVMNTEHEVRYFPVGAARIHSRSYTTRIAEVENPGKPDEHEKPVGNDGGFLWRLYSYWRFEEKAGGVFVQCEAISLTRGIPKLLAWLIKPFVTGIPRESLLNTLGSTRKALTAAPQTRTSPEGGTRSDWMPDAAEPAQPAFPRGLHSSHALARLRPLRPGP